MPDTFIELPGSERPIAKGARRVRDIDPHAPVSALVVLRAPSLPSIDDLPEKAVDPAELARTYAASSADVDKVTGVLKRYGIDVDGPTPSGRNLRISGPAAAMENAFKAGLAIYSAPGQGEFRGREGALSVPKELGGVVETVLGLDQRRTARHHEASVAAKAPAIAPLSPAELEQRYQFPDGDAAGQSVAIAEFGSPIGAGKVLPPAYFPNDVAQFCAQQGRPTPNIATVPVGLAPLTQQQVAALPSQEQQEVLDATVEVMMDVEIVASLCSGADISVYYAPWSQDGWVDLVERVTQDRPVALSASYGLAEDSTDWTAAALTAINNALQLAAMAGITVCISSGDDGSGCDMPGRNAHVEFPASSPAVLAVGGTMLAASAGVQEEVVWRQSPGRRTTRGGGATGGGVSLKFPRAAWQTVQVPSVNSRFDGRVVPDVAALAGPPYYQLVLMGRAAPNGGTSAAAPLWASLVARLNENLPAAKQQRFLARLLYAPAVGGPAPGAAGCDPITQGDNITVPLPDKGYSAGPAPGFNACAGWGVPKGQDLQAAL